MRVYKNNPTFPQCEPAIQKKTILLLGREIMTHTWQKKIIVELPTSQNNPATRASLVYFIIALSVQSFTW